MTAFIVILWLVLGGVGMGLHADDGYKPGDASFILLVALIAGPLLFGSELGEMWKRRSKAKAAAGQAKK